MINSNVAEDLGPLITNKWTPAMRKDLVLPQAYEWLKKDGKQHALPIKLAKQKTLTVIRGPRKMKRKGQQDRLPPKPAGMVREFFLSVTGWDKDADYHVVRGDEVGPLPWRGMDDQRYGSETRPAFRSDALHERFGSRWIGPKTFVRRDRSTSKP